MLAAVSIEPAHKKTDTVLSDEHVLGGVGIGPDCYW